MWFYIRNAHVEDDDAKIPVTDPSHLDETDERPADVMRAVARERSV